jgi:hypothetical protein
MVLDGLTVLSVGKAWAVEISMSNFSSRPRMNLGPPMEDTEYAPLGTHRGGAGSSDRNDDNGLMQLKGFGIGLQHKLAKRRRSSNSRG